MAKIESAGAAEYLEMLKKLTKETDGVCKHAVYKGAEVAANTIKQYTEAIPNPPEMTEHPYFYVSNGSKKAHELLRGLKEEEKQGLIKGLSITKMQKEDGSWNVKVSFGGYNDVKNSSFPKGEPNVMIARCVESGSLIREKTPFVSRAIRACKEKAEKEMEDAIIEKIEEIANT